MPVKLYYRRWPTAVIVSVMRQWHLEQAEREDCRMVSANRTHGALLAASAFSWNILVYVGLVLSRWPRWEIVVMPMATVIVPIA